MYGEYHDTPLEDATKTRLRVRAAHNGRSMEEQTRKILKSQLMPDAYHVNLAKASANTRRRLAASISRCRRGSAAAKIREVIVLDTKVL